MRLPTSSPMDKTSRNPPINPNNHSPSHKVFSTMSPPHQDHCTPVFPTSPAPHTTPTTARTPGTKTQRSSASSNDSKRDASPLSLRAPRTPAQATSHPRRSQTSRLRSSAPVYLLLRRRSIAPSARTVPLCHRRRGSLTRKTGWVSRLMRFPLCLAQRTYCGGLQNPLARLEELRRMQEEAFRDPELLFKRLGRM